MQKRLAELVREARERYIYSDEIAQYLIDHGVVVPVMCKDCEYCEHDGDDEIICTRRYSYVLPTDFCSYGERKEDETEL